MLLSLSAVEWFEGILFVLVSLGIIIFLITCLFLCISSSLKITAKFDKLKIGMPVGKVKSIMGRPDSENAADGMVFWRWERQFRGGCIARTVCFRDGVLHSLSRD